MTKNYRAAFLLILLALFPSTRLAAIEPLKIETILESVQQQYPPLLAAWVQQDIATGKARKAWGAFDPTLSATLNLKLADFYDGNHGEIKFEKPIRNLGGSIYGGYRISEGFLPDYERKIRTANGGEAILGFNLPLLRNREYDAPRATLEQAELNLELTKPNILKLHLDFLRLARVSYFTWLAAGKRLEVAERVLRIARERDASIGEKVKEGALAPIVQIDNHRLVVNRQISVLNAEREFNGACIALSLFHRNLETGQTILPTRQELPSNFPTINPIEQLDLVSDRARAAFRRPEIRQIEILKSKANVDRRLANNNLKPNLDLSFELNQAIGGDLPSDIEETEIRAIVSYSIPIGQNEAKGRVQAAKASIAQLEKERAFAQESIYADVDDSYTALSAAVQTLDRTLLNVQLSEELERAENEKFRQGASDLLSVQIREQATFEARLLEIDARYTYFKALANYFASTARDAPSHLPKLTK